MSIKKKLATLTAGTLGVFSATSYAALPAVVGTELTTIQTDSLAAIDLVWPVLMAIIGGFVIIKIVKRAVSKL